MNPKTRDEIEQFFVATLMLTIAFIISRLVVNAFWRWFFA